jgi:hypothetical protein
MGLILKGGRWIGMSLEGGMWISEGMHMEERTDQWQMGID